MKPSVSDLSAATTGLYAVVGNDISYSQSPFIFQTVFAALGWHADFARFDITEQELPHLLGAMRTAPIRGVSVTIPFKQRVLPLLDRLESTAKATGAVNTIAKVRGMLVGHNTDLAGVAQALASVRSRLKGREAIVFGAGGAARAVAYVLLTSTGMSGVTIAARRPAQARRLIHDLQDCLPPAHLASGAFKPVINLKSALSEAALVVNATPVGTDSSDRSRLLPADVRLNPTCVAFDLVYRPVPTRFCAQAKQAGCRTVIDGWPMLVAQAEAAFEIWTGRKFPAATKKHILGRLRPS